MHKNVFKKVTLRVITVHVNEPFRYPKSYDLIVFNYHSFSATFPERT
jgi:hypothetical protein